MTNEPFDLARRYGIEVQFADLGDWATCELRSEYDPRGPVIRINTRVIATLNGARVDGFVAFAVAHELYHHRERLGEVPVLRGRAQRETAADAFARSLLL